jgi:hypothetical protein
VCPDGISEGCLLWEDGHKTDQEAKDRAEYVATHLTAHDAPRDDVRRALDTLGDEARGELCRYLCRKGHMGPQLERLASLMERVVLPEGAPSTPVGVVFVGPDRPAGTHADDERAYQVHQLFALVTSDRARMFDAHLPGMPRDRDRTPADLTDSGVSAVRGAILREMGEANHHGQRSIAYDVRDLVVTVGGVPITAGEAGVLPPPPQGNPREVE